MIEISKMVFIAIMTILPLWILAHEVSQDEFVKSGAALVCAGIGITAMRMLFPSDQS